MPAALKEYVEEESQLDERRGETQEGFLEKGAFETSLEGLVTSVAWVPNIELSKHRLRRTELSED